MLKPTIRGFGYYIWKPHIILESLSKIQDDDILLYIDTGCHLNYKGKKKLIEYLRIVKNNDSGFLVSELESFHQEYKWTKGDILDYFGVRNDLAIINTSQYKGGIIFIRKNSSTTSLIQQWLNTYRYNFSLADDSPSKSSNLEGFKEARHDQSILSILLKKHGTSVIPVEEVYTTHWSTLEEESPILIKRDLVYRGI